VSAPIGIVVAHIKNQNVSTRYDLARGDDADLRKPPARFMIVPRSSRPLVMAHHCKCQAKSHRAIPEIRKNATVGSLRYGRVHRVLAFQAKSGSPFNVRFPLIQFIAFSYVFVRPVHLSIVASERLAQLLRLVRFALPLSRWRRGAALLPQCRHRH